MMTAIAGRSLRDAPTLRVYAALGVLGYAIGALGPTLALVRDRLELGNAVYGLHPSVLAAGLILAGLSGERPLERVGTDRLLRASLALLAAASAALAFAPAAAASLAAVAAFGIGQGLALAAIATDLRTRHGALAAVALSEANVVASAAGVLAPAALAGLVLAGLDGRLAMAALCVLAAPLLVSPVAGRPPAGDGFGAAAEGAGRRRGSFARWWLVLFLCQCVETCLLYWTAPYLQHRTGLSAGAAGGALTAFFAAQLVGRVSGTRAVRRHAPGPILAVSLALAGAGIVVLWAAATPALAVAALALASLGVANLYPVSAAATLAAGATAERAGVRVSLAIGAAGLTAPPLVGGIAAVAGLGAAFATLPVLAGAAAVALVAAARVR